jgi:AcrR family transcriptional regulator
MPKTQAKSPPTNPGPVRDDIVQAATRVFSQRGYHGASMTDVAEALGMRKPSLYHHVRKKEDLLFAIHERMVDDLIAHTMAVFSSSASPDVKLRQIMQEAMGFVGRHRDGVTVFLAEHRALSGDRWSEIVVKRDFYEKMVQGVIADGANVGLFVAMPTRITTKAILAMANWGYTWFRPDGTMTAEDVGDLMADIALNGLLVR